MTPTNPPQSSDKALEVGKVLLNTMRYHIEESGCFYLAEDNYKILEQALPTPAPMPDEGGDNFAVGWGVYNGKHLVTPWKYRSDAEQDLKEWKINGKDHYELRLLYSCPIVDHYNQPVEVIKREIEPFLSSLNLAWKNAPRKKLLEAFSERIAALNPQPAQEREVEPWDALLSDAKAEAHKAMSKFPQPNYVISKIAEEAGEVVKAAIHCAENRETHENLRGEMKQLIAMIYRLFHEGDQVHGLAPLHPTTPAQDTIPVKREVLEGIEKVLNNGRRCSNNVIQQGVMGSITFEQGVYTREYIDDALTTLREILGRK